MVSHMAVAIEPKVPRKPRERKLYQAALQEPSVLQHEETLKATRKIVRKGEQDKQKGSVLPASLDATLTPLKAQHPATRSYRETENPFK